MKRRRRPHGPACQHCPRVRALGHEYQCWRAAWEAAAEAVHVGYATERADYIATNPPPTFRRYLLDMAGSGWPMSGGLPQ